MIRETKLIEIHSEKRCGIETELLCYYCCDGGIDVTDGGINLTTAGLKNEE